MKLLILSVISFIGLSTFMLGLMNMVIFIISAIIIVLLLIRRSLIATGISLIVLSIYIFDIINVIIFTVLILIVWLLIMSFKGKEIIDKLNEFGRYSEDVRNKNYHKIYSDHQYFSQITNTFNEFVILKRTLNEYTMKTYFDTPGNKLLMKRDAGIDIAESIDFWLSKNDSKVFFDICYTSININDKYLTQYKNVELEGYTIYSFIATINYNKFNVPDKNKEFIRLMKLGHDISAKDRQVLNYMFLIDYSLWIINYIKLIDQFELPNDVKFILKKKFVYYIFRFLDF